MKTNRTLQFYMANLGIEVAGMYECKKNGNASLLREGCARARGIDVLLKFVLLSTPEQYNAHWGNSMERRKLEPVLCFPTPDHCPTILPLPSDGRGPG